jgi:hypothetical protein
MKLEIIRYNHDKESTQGLMALRGDFLCHTLEDQFQAGAKVMHETRIPEGIYQVGLMNALTDMTKRYRAKFGWFDFHLHVKDVPGFTSIYIHIGNDDDDTSGCILVADRAVNDPKDYASTVESSTTAYQRLYAAVRDAIRRGEQVTLEIKTIWQ